MGPKPKVKKVKKVKKTVAKKAITKAASEKKPPKPMKLSKDLAAIVGKKEASRVECIKELWVYLKKNNLQDPDDKRYFTPNKNMAKIFGTERIRGLGMTKFLPPHLS